MIQRTVKVINEKKLREKRSREGEIEGEHHRLNRDLSRFDHHVVDLTVFEQSMEKSSRAGKNKTLSMTL